jgi:hypothetical protein
LWFCFSDFSINPQSFTECRGGGFMAESQIDPISEEEMGFFFEKGTG